MVSFRTTALAGLLALAACGDEGPDPIEACTFALGQELRSPSTLSVVSSKSTPSSINDDQYDVWLSFDAANAYGAPVRGTAECWVARTVVGDSDAGERTTDAFVFLSMSVEGKTLTDAQLKGAAMDYCLSKAADPVSEYACTHLLK